MTRTGAEGTPPPPHRRRSIFRDDPPDAALSDAPALRDEHPRPSPHVAVPPGPSTPDGALADAPRSVRPRVVREHRSIFRSDPEHDEPGR